MANFPDADFWAGVIGLNSHQVKCLFALPGNESHLSELSLTKKSEIFGPRSSYISPGRTPLISAGISLVAVCSISAVRGRLR